VADSTDNLIHEHLRVLRAENAALADELREIKLRLQSIESTGASIKQDIANHYNEIALMNHRYDNVNSRLNCVERRLELI
jgi:chromosome segregation ATPase